MNKINFALDDVNQGWDSKRRSTWCRPRFTPINRHDYTPVMRQTVFFNSEWCEECDDEWMRIWNDMKRGGGIEKWRMLVELNWVNGISPRKIPKILVLPLGDTDTQTRTAEGTDEWSNHSYAMSALVCRHGRFDISLDISNFTVLSLVEVPERPNFIKTKI